MSVDLNLDSVLQVTVSLFGINPLEYLISGRQDVAVSVEGLQFDPN